MSQPQSEPQGNDTGLLPVPPLLAPVRQLVTRAVEMRAHDPVVAYFCKFAAARRALALPHRTDPIAATYLATLVDSLESDRAALGSHDALSSDLVGRAYLEAFATRVFAAADRAERAGTATIATARSFLASAVFFDALSMFDTADTNPGTTGDASNDTTDSDVANSIADKIRYAKYKAAEILRTIKAGNQQPISNTQTISDVNNSPSVPTTMVHTSTTTAATSHSSSSPPPASPSPPPTQSVHTTSSPAASIKAISPSSVSSTPITTPNQQTNNSRPETKPSVPISETTATAIPANVPSAAAKAGSDDSRKKAMQTDYAALAQASKLAKYAISALQYYDVSTARTNLLEALRQLDLAEGKAAP